MSSPRVTVSLRIRGDDLNPQEITAMLRTNPVSAAKRGSPVTFEGIVGNAPTGVWLLKLSAPEVELVEDQVRTLLKMVPSDVEVWRFLTERRFVCELFVGIFLSEINQGFEISPTTLKEIADRGLRIAFDVYNATASTPERPKGESPQEIGTA